jgi:hypothetical protein
MDRSLDRGMGEKAHKVLMRIACGNFEPDTIQNGQLPGFGSSILVGTPTGKMNVAYAS